VVRGRQPVDRADRVGDEPEIGPREETVMNIGFAFLSAGLGAGLMYLLDPEAGKRRVARVRDGSVRAKNKVTDVSSKAWRDGLHRLRGVAYETKARFAGNGVADRVVAERVRARMGRLVRHPGSIEVEVHDGCAILSGPILDDEVHDLIEKVRAVKGVREVENHLVAYKEPGDIPGLQGKRPLPRETSELAQENWAPSIRFVMLAAGTAAIVLGRAVGGLRGLMLSAAGLAASVRSLTNRPLPSAMGVGGPSAVEVQKTINIEAPVEHVFNLWCDFDNFPKFMSFVKDVRETDMETGITHWTLKGPVGIPVEWDAFVTDVVDNRLFAWKTVPGSTIRHKGTVRFDSNPDGSTKVDVRLCYSPPLGALGHAVAALLGADPKKRMDEDLLRMKTFIEEAKQPHDAAQKSASGLSGSREEGTEHENFHDRDGRAAGGRARNNPGGGE
jgi:uncharacterized membrane protein